MGVVGRHGVPEAVLVIRDMWTRRESYWRRAFQIAMKERLVDRYLKDNECRHGLYVVGWFSCDRWDDGDYRKTDAPRWPIEEARQRFATQTREYSSEDTYVESFVLDARLR